MIRLRPKVKIVIYDLDGTIKESVDLTNELKTCLLYTSDAADDLHSVDLGGRRII